MAAEDASPLGRLDAVPQLVNDPADVVDESIAGAVAASPNLCRLAGHRVVLRNDIEEFRLTHVTLVSGGGSGHEPAHVGYVGRGMLSAAVCGNVFASPPVSAIYAAIMAVAGPPGVLVIVKNYTGDRLNFGIAAEKAKAQGKHVKMVVVGDDCALPRRGKNAGRRGLAGTVFVHKIAGATAELGRSLEEVFQAADDVAGNIGTLGVALSPCVVPGRPPSFTLPPGTVELGLGIHGEPGLMQIPMPRTTELVSTMLNTILDPADDRGFLTVARGDAVALMVNNLGGTSVLEMGVVVGAAIGHLTDACGLEVHRVYSGSLMTSVAMAGVSLTVLRIPREGSFEARLDLPTSASGWPSPPQSLSSCGQGAKCADVVLHPAEGVAAKQDDGAEGDTVKASPIGATVKRAIAAAAGALIAAEAELDLLDGLTGDGDCGSTMAEGARRLMDSIDAIPVNEPAAALAAVGEHMGEHMGGSSGALYYLMLTAASAAMATESSAAGGEPRAWARALLTGAQAVSEYGGATEGDCTMLDVLLPVGQLLVSQLAEATSKESRDMVLKAASQLARERAEATSGMRAQAGRASYVDQERVVGNVDPGAKAAQVWLCAVAGALSGE